MRRRRRHFEAYRPQIRIFECSKCGSKVPASKYKRPTDIGHVKTMYCYRCKAETDHIQIE